MVLSTFNKELYEKDLKEAAQQEGLRKGREELNALYQKLIACGRTEDLQTEFSSIEKE